MRGSMTARLRGEAGACSCEPLEGRVLLSTITWENRENDGFDSVFGTDAAKARLVVEAAIQSWQRTIINFNYAFPHNKKPFEITVRMADSGTGLGAFAQLSGGLNGTWLGKPREGTITISRGNDTNGDGLGDGAGYFLDPTPEESSEFTGSIVNAFAGNATSASPAAGLADLYTLVLHEAGHLMGLSSDPRLLLTSDDMAVDTGQPDTINGKGNYWAFRGPSVKHLLTSFNAGENGGSDAGGAVHSARAGSSVTFEGSIYVGALDLENSYFNVGQRMLIPDTLALILKDQYNYSIAMPQSFGTFYAMLNNVTGGTELLIRGGSGTSADVISVERIGDDLRVSVDIGNDVAGTGAMPGAGNLPAFVRMFKAADVGKIRIEPGDGNDTIRLLGIDSIYAASTATISAGAGDDMVYIGGGNLGELSRTITVTGGGGNDSVIVDDSAVADRGYTLNGGLLQRDGTAVLNASDIDVMSLLANSSIAALSLSGGGKLALPAAAATLHIGSLSISGAVLDVGDNNLVLSATLGTRDAVLGQVSGWIGSSALINSTAAAGSPRITGLAAAINGQADGTKLLSAEDSSAVLVKYTYNGDMNFDGVVNALDYFRIDSGFLAGATGYVNGDLNHDGTVNALDYFLIDSAFLGQNGPLSGSVAAVALAASAGESDPVEFSTRQIRPAKRTAGKVRELIPGARRRRGPRSPGRSLSHP